MKSLNQSSQFLECFIFLTIFVITYYEW